MKQCGYCKTELNDHAKFCSVCGKEVPAEKKAGKKKMLPIIIVAVAVVCILVSVVLLLQGGRQGDSDFYYPEQNLAIMMGSGRTGVGFLGTEKAWEEKQATYWRVLESSTDTSAVIFSDYEDVVYLADENGVTEILPTEEALSSLSLSPSGNGVAYKNAYDGKLYFQQIPIEGEPVAIQVEIGPEDTDFWFRISADGSSVAYQTYENGTYVTYVYRDGQHMKIGENLKLHPFSDTADYFFCYESETYDLYVADFQGRFEKLAESTSIYPCFVNQDFSQFMFMDEGEWYVVENGSTVTQMTGFPEVEYSINTLVTPKFAVDCTSGYCYVDNLCGNYYQSSRGEGLFYLDENWNWTLIDEEIENCQRGQGEDVIYYTEDYLHPERGAHTRLYRLNGGNPQDIEVVNEYIWDFTVSKDGNTVYYLDTDNCLWSVKGNGSPQLIAEEVEEMQITHDDYLLFTAAVPDSSGSSYTYSLYGAKNGKNPVEIAEDVDSLLATGSATYYTKSGEDSSYEILYATEKGIDFELLMEVMDSIIYLG